MGRRYLWINDDFEDWVRKQRKQLEKDLGVKISNESVTKLLVGKVLIPNNINLTNMLSPIKIKIRKGRINL